jgi:hypothetical protein
MAEIPTPIDILVPIIGSERFSELEDARKAVHKARRGSADWPPNERVYKTYNLRLCQVALENLRLTVTKAWFDDDDRAHVSIPDNIKNIYIHKSVAHAEKEVKNAKDAKESAYEDYEKLSPELRQSLDAKYQADAQRQAEAQSSTAPAPVGMLSLM